MAKTSAATIQQSGNGQITFDLQRFAEEAPAAPAAGSLLSPAAPAVEGAPPAEAPAEGSPAEPEAKDEPQGAPESYEFTAPEGETLDPDFLGSFGDIAKDLDLTQAKAQALLDKAGPLLQERQLARNAALRKEWADSSRADQEFGGDKLDANLAIAKRAMDQFGTPEFSELITGTGLGEHPEVIRFLHRVGQAISEDSIEMGRKGRDAGPSGPLTFEQKADKFYPKKV